MARAARTIYTSITLQHSTKMYVIFHWRCWDCLFTLSVRASVSKVNVGLIAMRNDIIPNAVMHINGYGAPKSIRGHREKVCVEHGEKNEDKLTRRRLHSDE